MTNTTTSEICFQNVFDIDNDHSVKGPGHIHEVKILVSVINRNNQSEVLSDHEVVLNFYNERLWIGGSDMTSFYEHSTICYWIKKRALNYFYDTNYKEKPEDVKKFKETTKDKTWCFDAVVLETTEKYWDGKQIV